MNVLDSPGALRRCCTAIPYLLFAVLNYGCGERVVTRIPVEVPDVPVYGDELRALELNPPEPTPADQYQGPGYYVRWSPDGKVAATTTTARGYYRTVNIWEGSEQRRRPLISIEDGDPGSGRAYRYSW